MMRIIARRTEAAAMRQWRSKSRASLRLRLIHACVRSPIQRFGRTTKRCRSQPDGGGHPWPLIARVADDAPDEGEQLAHLPQQRLGAVPVLHAGRMHHDAQQQALRVGHDVALTPANLLAPVVA